LVPLVKVLQALQAELGEERANAFVRKARGDVYRHIGEQWWRAKESKNLGEDAVVSALQLLFALRFLRKPRIAKPGTDGENAPTLMVSEER
jgi:hypothetical protein